MLSPHHCFIEIFNSASSLADAKVGLGARFVELQRLKAGRYIDILMWSVNKLNNMHERTAGQPHLSTVFLHLIVVL